MPQPTAVDHSRHFTIEELAEGVYAVFASMGGAFICNAGIIDLGGLCLVYDTGLTPSAGEDLRRAVGQLAGDAPLLVINSHFHNDHTWGNQAFPAEARVIASRRTRELILTWGKEELEDARQNAAHYLEVNRQRLALASDEKQRNVASLFLGYYQGLVDDLPRLAPRLPEILFDGQMAFHGERCSAELIAYDDSHSGSDAALLLPAEGIAFLSDLLFVRCHPYLGDGDPAHLQVTLRQILELPATKFVPGHGPLGSKTDIEAEIAYIQGSFETARELVASGQTDEAALAAQAVPAAYRDWEFPSFYAANLRAICQRLAGGG